MSGDWDADSRLRLRLQPAPDGVNLFFDDPLDNERVLRMSPQQRQDWYRSVLGSNEGTEYVERQLSRQLITVEPTHYAYDEAVSRAREADVLEAQLRVYHAEKVLFKLGRFKVTWRTE